MPSVRYIHWQDAELRPNVQQLIPAGRRVIINRRTADHYFASVITDLAPYWQERYTILWDAALTAGYHPNGLIFVNLASLIPAAERHSNLVPKQFASFCRDTQIWTRIHGRLEPPLDTPHRYRCYLITRPEGTSLRTGHSRES
jgi:hypothetical protein